MKFIEEKICITRKDLLKENYKNVERYTYSEVLERPTERILCQMIKEIIDTQEVA